MTRTYQATGIIIKGMPLGEADRLVTILTPEYGLIRAVAPGARKYKSKLRGRSELFVVNQLLLTKGRSLDKIAQAETIKSYPGLSRDLGKLSASQYLAELVLSVSLSEQPQTDLYELFTEHLRRLEQLGEAQPFASHLAQAVFHLLAITGIAPQVHTCCLTQEVLSANFSEPNWRVGFSYEAGGAIALATKVPTTPTFSSPINTKLGALELALLQHLGAKSLPQPAGIVPKACSAVSVDLAWIKVERLLRDYTQYHIGRSFRSAVLVDTLSSPEF